MAFFCLLLLIHPISSVFAEEDSLPQNAVVRFGDEQRQIPILTSERTGTDIPDAIEELVKSQILSRLNMKEAPPSSESLPPPSEVINILLNDTVSQVQVSNPKPEEKQVIYATNYYFRCLHQKSSLCRRFQFKLPSVLKSTTVDVYVHKVETTPPSELSVAVFYTNSPEDEISVLEHKEFFDRSDNAGWISFEMPTEIDFYFWNDTLFCTIEVSGAEVATEGDQRPFLLLRKHPPKEGRARRDITCDSTTYRCCLVPFRISFDDIGWGEFIYQPRFVDVNFCMGECWQDRSKFQSHYLRALATLLENNNTLAEQLGKCWAPSCRPNEMQGMDIIYVDNSSSIHYQNLPNMIVKSCACG